MSYPIGETAAVSGAISTAARRFGGGAAGARDRRGAVAKGGTALSSCAADRRERARATQRVADVVRVRIVSGTPNRRVPRRRQARVEVERTRCEVRRDVATRWWFAPAPPERLAALRLSSWLRFWYLWVRFGDSSRSRSSTWAVEAGRRHAWSGHLPQAGSSRSRRHDGRARRARARGSLSHHRADRGDRLLFVTTYRNSWGMVFHTRPKPPRAHVGALALSRRPMLVDRRMRGGRARIPPATAGDQAPGRARRRDYMLRGIAKLRIPASTGSTASCSAPDRDRQPAQGRSSGTRSRHSPRNSSTTAAVHGCSAR